MSFRLVESLESRLLFSTLPANFVETNVANLTTSVAATMTFAPDGRLFVGDTTKGQIRLIKNGALQPNPVLSLDINKQSERGINGIAIDPNFATAPAGQKYIYVYYTTNEPTPVNRLSRFTISTSNADQLDPNSELPLIINIPSTNGNHNGGALNIGADGKLYLGVGEAGVASNAQDLSNLLGKVLRINRDGSIPADNPFVGTPGARPEIWAYGLRNPFTGAIRPGTSTLYINDVGQSSWEEVDDIQKGANYGWPNVEGVASNPAFVNPIHAYPREGSTAVTGGTFYTGSDFPSSYAGDYFFADYLQRRIRVMDTATKQVTIFASATPQFVDLDVNPLDGSLYGLAINGAVQRIAYNTPQPPPPTGDVTLTATAAAHVKDGSTSSTNFGSATTLEVKKSTAGFNRESYLKFDMTSVSAVGSAKLRVFGKLSSTEASSVSVAVHGVSTTTWIENNITFSNKPAAGAAIASATVTGTTARWYEFDVTAYAKSNTGKLISFDLKAANGALPIVQFNSDESAANKPQLVISSAATGNALAPNADATVRDGSSANANFGAGSTLTIKKSTPGYTRETYLRFDLSSLSSINSAKLRLFGGFEASPASPVRIAAFGLSAPNTAWNESTVTWNNKPATGAQIASVTFNNATQAAREWDLTAYLKSEKAAGRNAVTIVLRALDASTPAANFASDESTTNRPQLIVS